jgi:hypothetical protein
VSDPIDAGDPSTWDPRLDAVTAAPKNHKVLFENDALRVLEVILEPDEEEPVHHHRWRSVFMFDQVLVMAGTIPDVGIRSSAPVHHDCLTAVGEVAAKERCTPPHADDLPL